MAADEPNDASAEAALVEIEATRQETSAQRIDRNWNELLQELRVTQTGVQILFAFLLTLPFQSSFNRVSSFDRILYLVVISLVTTSTVLNLAPVIAHRVLFRRRQKDILLNAGDAFARMSFVTLGLALIGAVAFVVDLVSGHLIGLVFAGGASLLVLALWVGFPLWVIRQRSSGPDRY